MTTAAECPAGCHTPVYVLPADTGQRILDTEHDPLGAWTIDGGRVRPRTTEEIARGVAGYRLHECPDGLF